MIFKRIGFIVVSLLFLTISLPVSAQPIKVYAENHCSERISLAYNYKSTGGDWIKRGWLIIKPGEKKRTNIVTNNRIFYFYATSPGGRKWSGKGKAGSIWKYVIGNKFKTYNDEPIYGRNKRRVKFIKQRIKPGTKSFTAHFRCR